MLIVSDKFINQAARTGPYLQEKEKQKFSLESQNTGAANIYLFIVNNRGTVKKEFLNDIFLVRITNT